MVVSNDSLLKGNAAYRVSDIESEVDSRRCKQGFNVIPADSVKKKTWVQWKNGPINFQFNPIPEQTHNQWLTTNQFKDGYAVVVGPLWFGEDKGKYDLCLDFDKWNAIKSFFGGTTDEESWNNVKKFAQTNRVEYREHDEEKFKLHVFINTTRLFKVGLSGKRNRHLLIGLEVRVEKELVYCGQREGGKCYKPLGTSKTSTWHEDQLLELEKKIDELAVEDNHQTTAEEREDPSFWRDENENRSINLLQQMGTILRRYLSKHKKIHLSELTELELQEVKLQAMKWYQSHEKEYPNSKFEDNWNQELKYIEDKITEEEKTEADRETWVKETYQKYKGQQKQEPPNEISLENQIEGKDYVKYIVDTANKTVKQEDVLVSVDGSGAAVEALTVKRLR